MTSQLYDKENQLHDHFGTFARVGATHEQYGGYEPISAVRRLVTIGDALRERVHDGLAGRRGRVAWDIDGTIIEGFDTEAVKNYEDYE